MFYPISWIRFHLNNLFWHADNYTSWSSTKWNRFSRCEIFSRDLEEKSCKNNSCIVSTLCISNTYPKQDLDSSHQRSCSSDIYYGLVSCSYSKVVFINIHDQVAVTYREQVIPNCPTVLIFIKKCSSEWEFRRIFDRTIVSK